MLMLMLVLLLPRGSLRRVARLHPASGRLSGSGVVEGPSAAGARGRWQHVRCPPLLVETANEETPEMRKHRRRC